jgi:hypothetical protein
VAAVLIAVASLMFKNQTKNNHIDDELSDAFAVPETLK